MAIKSLGYIGIGASDVGKWHRYASEILGTMVEETDHGLNLRVDELAWRVAIEPDPCDDILYAGWDVGTADALEALALRLKEAGVPVERDTGAVAGRRGVMALIACKDPNGMRCEFYWGASVRFEKPFISPVGGAGFLTGDQGLGHIVTRADDPAAMSQFYIEVLGFRLSDHIDDHSGPGTVRVTFLHCNTRHHSLAFVKVPSPKILQHMMLQTNKLDDVGLALNRLAARKMPLSLTLGRHSNDHMLSFYAFTPSGFEIEYGWGAREIDDATWSPVRHDHTSIWGHELLVPRGSPPPRF